jgi:hypothetical protein
VGHSLTFDAQLVDITHAVVLKRYSHRIQNADSDEAFLDEIGPAVSALFPDAQPEPPPAVASTRAPPQVQAPAGSSEAPRFVVAVGGAAELTGKGAMASARIGYDVLPQLELRAEGLYTGRSFAGAAPGVAFVPFNAAGMIRPELGAAVPILFSSPVSVGGELLVGAQVVPVSWLVASVEVPAMWFAAAPDGQRKVYAFAQASVGARF